MPVTGPTRRRLHETKLSRRRNIRKKKRRCRGSVIGRCQIDLNIVETRFTGRVRIEARESFHLALLSFFLESSAEHCAVAGQSLRIPRTFKVALIRDLRE